MNKYLETQDPSYENVSAKYGWRALFPLKVSIGQRKTWAWSSLVEGDEGLYRSNRQAILSVVLRTQSLLFSVL